MANVKCFKVVDLFRGRVPFAVETPVAQPSDFPTQIQPLLDLGKFLKVIIFFLFFYYYTLIGFLNIDLLRSCFSMCGLLLTQSMVSTTEFYSQLETLPVKLFNQTVKKKEPIVADLYLFIAVGN